MKILVTGGAGYIGSVLVPRLIQEGHEIVVVDKLMFGNNLKDCSGYTLHERDILDFDPQWLEGIDAVIHLAALSNDPMANFRPRDNFVYNTAGTALMVYLCKQAGVKRFIFGSTCSVYGFSADHEMRETERVSPKFPYGISKVQCEQAILSAEDENFYPLVFRQATVYGWAPRMRFDLVVNTMTKYGVKEKKIVVNSPELWRPLVHVRDLVEAYVAALKAPLALTGIINVSGKNYQIKEVAQEVHAALGEKGIDAVIETKNEQDMRNYRVDTRKAVELLGFQPKHSVQEAVKEIVEKIGEHSNPEWDNPWYLNAEVYRNIILKDEEQYKMWKKFLENAPHSDDVPWRKWPQEAP